MTSDAKIGLLLGLVFIFIIAILVNGIPKFGRSEPTNELTTDNNIIRMRSETPAIAARERKINREVIEPPVRYSRPLNLNIERQVQPMEEVFEPAGSETGTKEQSSIAAGQIADIRTAQPSPTAEKQTARVERIEPPKARIERIEPPKAKTYVVVEGDFLATIAQKFYGPVEGNRQVNVDKIFAANKSVLESPDSIYPGQKLVIPPLSVSVENTVSKTLNSPLLEEVDTIGRRHLANVSESKEKVSLYTVVEDDSLWKIAADKLGDGSRYMEIYELNKNIMPNEHTVFVGMRLRLPSR